MQQNEQKILKSFKDQEFLEKHCIHNIDCNLKEKDEDKKQDEYKLPSR